MKKQEGPSAKTPPTGGFPASAWPKIGGRPGCFLGEFSFDTSGEVEVGPLKNATIYVFGGYNEAPYEGKGEFKGKMMKWPQFAVVEKKGAAIKSHLLFQGADRYCSYSTQAEHDRAAKLPKEDPRAYFNDPVWKARFDFGSDAMEVLNSAVKSGTICPELMDRLYKNYKDAGEPKPRKKWLKEHLLPEYRCVRMRPRWVEAEGEWPVYNGAPMLFVGQIAVPQNDVTVQSSCGGEMVYLFAGWSGAEAEFKLQIQDTGEQTAEEHYAAEEMMQRYVEAPGDPKALQQCVSKGDQYVHEFLLQQRGLSKKGLELLASKGANKNIREEARLRLRG